MIFWLRDFSYVGFFINVLLRLCVIFFSVWLILLKLFLKLIFFYVMLMLFVLFLKEIILDVLLWFIYKKESVWLILLFCSF